jgi:hypothetical protein
MIDIRVKGGSKLQHEIVRNLSQFVKEKYFDNHKNVSIEFTIKKHLGRDDGCDGLCFPLSNTKPREFEVDIDKDLPLMHFIKTVIHELIHVKQYVTGQLSDKVGRASRVIWKGRDHSKTTYSRQPWEREAYRLQEKLFIEFMAK